MKDTRPDEEMIVVGFKCSNPYLATKGGIRVGMSYRNDVLPKYGAGIKYVNRGEIMYAYDGGKMMQFYFYVDEDDEDTIVKIGQGTDW